MCYSYPALAGFTYEIIMILEITKTMSSSSVDNKCFMHEQACLLNQVSKPASGSFKRESSTLHE